MKHEPRDTTATQPDDATLAAPSAIEIGLPSADIEAMERFYGVSLGLRHCGTVDLPSAHIEAYRAGACLLKFTIFTNEAERPSPKPPDSHAPYISVKVEDIAALVARCEAQGFVPLTPISVATTATGRQVRFAFFVDPMGNRVEIVEGNAWEHPA